MGVEFKCVTVTNTVLMVLESKKDSLDVGSVFSPLCMLVGEYGVSLSLPLHTSVWVY